MDHRLSQRHQRLCVSEPASAGEHCQNGDLSDHALLMSKAWPDPHPILGTSGVACAAFASSL